MDDWPETWRLGDAVELQTLHDSSSSIYLLLSDTVCLIKNIKTPPWGHSLHEQCWKPCILHIPVMFTGMPAKKIDSTRSCDTNNSSLSLTCGRVDLPDFGEFKMIMLTWGFISVVSVVKNDSHKLLIRRLTPVSELSECLEHISLYLRGCFAAGLNSHPSLRCLGFPPWSSVQSNPDTIIYWQISHRGNSWCHRQCQLIIQKLQDEKTKKRVKIRLEGERRKGLRSSLF